MAARSDPRRICDEAPLCSSFPCLYQMANSKGAKIADLWDCQGAGEARILGLKEPALTGKWF